MKLSEYSKYRTNRERAEAILHILEGMPGKTLHDDKGLLTSKLIKMLPKHLGMGRTSKPMTTSGMVGQLHQMEEAGWIMMETNGKRTFNIFLVSLPDDWDLYRVVDHSHVPEPMVMPVTMPVYPTPDPAIGVRGIPDKLPEQVAEKLNRAPVTGDQLREIVRSEVQAALAEWWASLS